eukprot:519259_1
MNAADPTKQAYMSYIAYCAEKGYPPKLAKHLISFSRIHKPPFQGVMFKDARDIISNPPNIDISSVTESTPITQLDDLKINEPQQPQATIQSGATFPQESKPSTRTSKNISKLGAEWKTNRSTEPHTNYSTKIELNIEANDDEKIDEYLIWTQFIDHKRKKPSSAFELSAFTKQTDSISSITMQTAKSIFQKYKNTDYQPTMIATDIPKKPKFYCTHGLVYGSVCAKCQEYRLHLKKLEEERLNKEQCETCGKLVETDEGKWCTDVQDFNHFYCTECWILWNEQTLGNKSCKKCGARICRYADDEVNESTLDCCMNCFYVLDVKKKGKEMIVKRNTATSNGYGYQNIYARERCKLSKKYCYSIKIERLMGSKDIIIGIIEANTHYVDCSIMGAKNCIALYSANFHEQMWLCDKGICGYPCQEHYWQQPQKLSASDKVQVILEGNTVSFTINEKQFGKQMQIVEDITENAEQEYCLIVSLGDKGSAVTATREHL